MFSWSNNCAHQAVDLLESTKGIRVGDEFKYIDSPYKAARLIRPHKSIFSFLSAVPYLRRVDVKKAKIGDLMIFKWGGGLLHFSLAVNSDGITSIGPCENGNLFFKTLNADAAFEIWQDQ